MTPADLLDPAEVMQVEEAPRRPVRDALALGSWGDVFAVALVAAVFIGLVLL